MYKKFKCSVDPETDYIDVDASQLEAKHGSCVYIQIFNNNKDDGDIVCLSREDVKELARFLIASLEGTK
jgi:hypothetical protein